MNDKELTQILQSLTDGHIEIAEVVKQLQHLPFEDLGIAQIDYHRELRQGVPEIILGESKSLEQLHKIPVFQYGLEEILTDLELSAEDWTK